MVGNPTANGRRGSQRPQRESASRNSSERRHQRAGESLQTVRDPPERRRKGFQTFLQIAALVAHAHSDPDVAKDSDFALKVLHDATFITKPWLDDVEEVLRHCGLLTRCPHHTQRGLPNQTSRLEALTFLGKMARMWWRASREDSESQKHIGNMKMLAAVYHRVRSHMANAETEIKRLERLLKRRHRKRTRHSFPDSESGGGAPAEGTAGNYLHSEPGTWRQTAVEPHDTRKPIQDRNHSPRSSRQRGSARAGQSMPNSHGRSASKRYQRDKSNFTDDAPDHRSASKYVEMPASRAIAMSQVAPGSIDGTEARRAYSDGGPNNQPDSATLKTAAAYRSHRNSSSYSANGPPTGPTPTFGVTDATAAFGNIRPFEQAQTASMPKAPSPSSDSQYSRQTRAPTLSSGQSRTHMVAFDIPGKPPRNHRHSAPGPRSATRVDVPASVSSNTGHSTGHRHAERRGSQESQSTSSARTACGPSGARQGLRPPSKGSAADSSVTVKQSATPRGNPQTETDSATIRSSPNASMNQDFHHKTSSYDWPDQPWDFANIDEPPSRPPSGMSCHVGSSAESNAQSQRTRASTDAATATSRIPTKLSSRKGKREG